MKKITGIFPSYVIFTPLPFRDIVLLLHYVNLIALVTGYLEKVTFESLLNKYGIELYVYNVNSNK